MIFDPQHTYLHVADDGSSQTVPAEAFWQLASSASDTFGKGWLVSEYAFTQDWPNWEMHPQGDELVYLLSGAVDLLLEQGGAVRTISLDGAGAVVVPRGVWHTARVRAPSRMLHVTRGEGTESRPASP